MDETALAIARLREEARSDNAPKPGLSAKPGRMAIDKAQSRMGHVGLAHPKPGGQTPSPSTKRPKTFGS